MCRKSKVHEIEEHGERDKLESQVEIENLGADQKLDERLKHEREERIEREHDRELVRIQSEKENNTAKLQE